MLLTFSHTFFAHFCSLSLFTLFLASSSTITPLALAAWSKVAAKTQVTEATTIAVITGSETGTTFRGLTKLLCFDHLDQDKKTYTYGSEHPVFTAATCVH